MCSQKSSHKLTEILRQLWKLVDVLARVLAVRYAEAELEVEAFEQAVAKEVSLNHAKIVHRLRTDTKFDSEKG